MGKRWFVARTKTAGEVRASVAVAACGFDVFLPVQRVRRAHARKVEEISRPLFPRYLFVSFDPSAKSYGSINNCRGIASRGLIVTAGGEPVPVPDSVIAQIRKDEAAMLAKSGEITTGYCPGEIFQLPYGHATLCATYMGEEKGKVWALVDMFGKAHLIAVDFSAVPAKNLIDARVA